MSKKLAVGLIGCGYWGPNLIRNFAACPLTEMKAVFDGSADRRHALRRQFPFVEVVDSLEAFLDLPLDAAAIATPVSTHFELAGRCMEAGLHVLVEKPLAETSPQSAALVEQSERLGRVLMVDHTYLFSNAVRRIKQAVEQGELGELYYVDSIRINLGRFQHDVNVIWDLAPHDFAITDYILGAEARSIAAWGANHVETAVEDVAYVNVDYGDRLMTNFHVNWLSPVKVRQMIFAGSRRSLIFNELNVSEPIKIYDRGIELADDVEARRKVLVNYRTGDVWSPHIEPGEALQGVVCHFAECIRRQEQPLSDGRMGLRVVRLLESATRSLRAQGGRIVLANGAAAVGRASRPFLQTIVR